MHISRVYGMREHNLIICSPIQLQNTSMVPLSSMDYYSLLYTFCLCPFVIVVVICLAGAVLFFCCRFILVIRVQNIQFSFRLPHSFTSLLPLVCVIWTRCAIRSITCERMYDIRFKFENSWMYGNLYVCVECLSVGIMANIAYYSFA